MFQDPFTFQLKIYNNKQTLIISCLVAVCKTAHTAHHTQHVVVHRVDADLSRALTTDRVDGQRQVQRRLVDTREVARAAGLVLLRLERKGVHVDTR